ncbi:MAG: hypothetical protein E7Z92_03505 [Cyanobacteria bacterium SIG31]|nr:hypothetical protein [Cyanobacteria bacterium SIG31]
MRIQFNQTIQGHMYQAPKKGLNYNKLSLMSFNPSEAPASPVLSFANFPNINFRARNIDADFLLSQTKRLKCAYSGKFMLPQCEIKEIFQKLERRPNAQSAINLLQIYERYMHETESAIFNLFKDAKHKGKLNFQDILKSLQPAALARLKEKQIKVIKSADKYIAKMGPPTAELVQLIRDNALAKIEDNSFGRQPPLEMIKAVKAKGADLNRVIKVYQTWYKLPNSARDVDAFIVKYARKSHQEIARRLICSAMATVEHIVPQSRKKIDSLSNMILVSARFNNERHSMPLDEYIMLNQDIDMKGNLQKYLDLVIKEVARKKSDFAERGWYPEKIQKAIEKETSGKVLLNIDSLALTKEQKKDINAPQKLIKKFSAE